MLGNSSERSIGERSRNIGCKPPSRTRRDDQIVELFLCAWSSGRFANDPQWLCQSKSNVEVIAKDDRGTRLAVEHTRIFAFKDHKRQEALLRPIAEQLEAEPGLNVPDRCFEIQFYPGFLNGLKRPLRRPYAEALAQWAANELLHYAVQPEVYHLRVPALLQGEAPEVNVDVTVSERMLGVRPVSVGGCLPPDSDRMLPLLRKALEDKLPKLDEAEAEFRTLLLDLPTLDSKERIIRHIRNLHSSYGKLDRINHLVIATTFGLEKFHFVRFFVYQVGTYDLVDAYRVEIVQSTDRGRNSVVTDGL